MAVKVHHLNCGWFGSDVTPYFFPTEKMCCHCLLLETDSRLILVDAGLPNETLLREERFLYSLATNAQRPASTSAIKQVEKLGFNPKDVQDIVATHLDIDHIGGIQDFPWARLHLHQAEAQILNEDQKHPYRYVSKVWSHHPQVSSYGRFGEKWFGFDAVRGLYGLPPEILLVPLLGHTHGHSGVAIQQANGWLLHAGDAFMFREDLSFPLNRHRISSELFQTTLAMNNMQRLTTLAQVAALKKTQPEVEIINTHDPRYLPGSLQNSPELES